MHYQTVNLYVLSAKPLEQSLRVETGAYLPVELAIGPDLLLNKNIEALRKVVPRAVINVCVLHPYSNSSADGMNTLAYLQARMSNLNDPNIRLKLRGVDLDSKELFTTGFYRTFQTIRDDLKAKKGADDSPIFIMPGDVLFSPKHFQTLLVDVNFGVKNIATLFLKPNPDEIISDRWTIFRESKDLVLDRTIHEFDARSDYLYSGLCMFRGSKSFVARFAPARTSPNDAAFFSKLLIESDRFISDDTVYDFGHLDTYWHSRFAHLSARTFNSIKFDDQSLFLTKTSTSDVFDEQAEWYNLSYWYSKTKFRGKGASSLPLVNVYLPRTSNYVHGNKNILDIEALPYHPVSELIFNPEFKPAHQTAFIRRAVRAICAMYNSGGKTIKSSGTICKLMYAEKTIDRLHHLLEDSLYQNLVFSKSDTRVPVVELSAVLEQVRDYTRSRCLEDKMPYKMSPIHGDFCLSNLLFDLRTTSLKMIDPRGKFGLNTIFEPGLGDIAYDIAKMRHSLTGGYDLVLAGVLRSGFNNNHVYREQNVHDNGAANRLRFMENRLESELQSAVDSGMLPYAAIERSYRIQPLLFLSMLPLHKENFGRVITLASIGINQFYDELNP